MQLLMQQLLHSVTQLRTFLLHMLALPHNDGQFSWNAFAMLEALLQRSKEPSMITWTALPWHIKLAVNKSQLG